MARAANARPSCRLLPEKPPNRRYRYYDRYAGQIDDQFALSVRVHIEQHPAKRRRKGDDMTYRMTSFGELEFRVTSGGARPIPSPVKSRPYTTSLQTY
jgi:hypothetical protein